MAERTKATVLKTVQVHKRASALGFIASHQGQVSLITIDIGLNDLLVWFGPSGAIDSSCVTDLLPIVRSNVETIVAALRTAAGPNTRIVGSTFYDPVLFFWLAIDPGLAQANHVQIQRLNEALEDAFAAEGVPCRGRCRCLRHRGLLPPREARRSWLGPAERNPCSPPG